MTSAILTNRNRFPNPDSNPNLFYNRFQNLPNPNPNPNSGHIFYRSSGIGSGVRQPVPFIPPANGIAPAKVYGQRLFTNPSPNPNPNLNPNCGQFFNQTVAPASVATPAGIRKRFVRYRLGSYTKKELLELKERLISDLERVRSLRKKIDAPPVPEVIVPKVMKNVGPKCAVKKVMKKPVRDTKIAKQRGRKKKEKEEVKVKESEAVIGMRECGKILAKLMRLKNANVFNRPVNAAALKLWDYHNVIKNPMDLGTIKKKIKKNEYKSSLEFASDVRLTFKNAMEYNGKDSVFYDMAESFLLMFEDLFGKMDLSRNEAILVDEPAQKRVMTAVEKAELADMYFNLQLEPEEMVQFTALGKKGGLGLVQQGDEIELDLAVLDNDTLWELHTFVSKLREKPSESCDPNGALAHLAATLHTDNFRASELERDGGDEEDIDIGEEMQLTDYPTVEIEKDAANASSCGSSSSSGSSSSRSSTSSSGSSDSSSGKSGNDQEIDMGT